MNFVGIVSNNYKNKNMFFIKPFAILIPILVLISFKAFSQQNQNKVRLIDNLYEFSKTSAVTGREEQAASYIKSLLQNKDLKEDRLGNLVLTMGSGAPRRLITAPLDEPGYVISEIQKDGYLRFNPVGIGHNGNLYHQFLEGHEVQINTENGSVIGVSTVPSAHFERLRITPESSKTPFKWQEGYIDIGLSGPLELLQKDIHLLDPITLHKKPTIINNSYIAAPSMRSKAAAIALAVIAKDIAKKEIDGTLVIAWTTLELINGKGIEAVINTHGPFSEIHRFNRFLESDKIDQKTLLANGISLNNSINYLNLKPKTSFTNPVTTVDFENQVINEIGLPCLYPDTPVEMVAITDIENLIDHWSHVVSGIIVQKEIGKGILNLNHKSYTSFVNESNLLVDLIGEYGVSKAEKNIRNVILNKLPKWAKPKIDSKGNIVLTFGQGNNHIGFIAHMDETGYVVDSIEADGKLLLKRRGGMLPWIWEAQPALVHVNDSKINGVFEPREDYKVATKRNIEKPLKINAGFNSMDNAIAAGIEVGTTTVTMPKKMIRLNENKATARGFDDRAGCAALLLSLKNLNPKSITQKVTFVWSVEEEVGLNGAVVAAVNLKDLNVVYPIDTYVSSDDPYLDESFADCPLGNGAVIRVLESINFISRANLKNIQKLAKEYNIKVQYGMTAGGTDGQPFLGYGIPSVPLSWPGRYSHSPVEILDYRDVNNLVLLINAIIKNPNNKSN